MTTGYYLLDHPNPHGPHFYTSRRSPITAVVLHVTASLEDYDLRGVDGSAEATARYAATTERPVSWHIGADSDSFVRLLPFEYTAFHVHGFNSPSVGLEFSKKDVDWRNKSPEWIRRTLRNGARGVWPVARHIPRRLLNREQALAGVRGFVHHSVLDPQRRTDAGVNFPAAQFFGELAALAPAPPPPVPPRVTKGHEMIICKTVNGTGYLLMNNGTRIRVANQDDYNAFVAAGVPQATLTDDQINNFKDVTTL